MPQQYIDFAFVKDNASFEQVIACYNLKLVGKGSQRSVLCPFHRERKPSCKIDLDRKIFHCFGCEAKGNLLEFVARMEGDAEDLRAAAVRIAEICGIATAAPRERAGASSTREHRRKGARPRKPKRAAPTTDAAQITTARVEVHGGLTDAGIHGAAVPPNRPLTFQLKLDPAHPYLAERGLSAEVIALFGLGYCSRGSMAGRICTPIHDERGQLVAYAGRWPGDEGIPEGEDRYKLPAKFQKARVVFNLHRVSDAEHVVLVEGFWSVFRLHAFGVPVVGLMGWSVSTDQVALLRDRGVRFVTLLLDGDDTGRRGRERVVPDLASSFFVRAPLLPEGEKPDTLEETQLLSLVQFSSP
jgi:DNA primase